MRFYKVFGAKNETSGLESKEIRFFQWNFNEFCVPGTQNCFLGTQNCSLDAHHGVLEARLSVLEARLGGPERHLGDYCMLLNGVGRFQNALGTFQEAPERESLIFQWFWEVLVGGPKGVPSRGGDCPTP